MCNINSNVFLLRSMLCSTKMKLNRAANSIKDCSSLVLRSTSLYDLFSNLRVPYVFFLFEL